MTLQLRYLYGVLICLLALTTTLHAQNRPPQGRFGGSNGQMNMGRFYGKIIDDEGKGIGYASVQLISSRFDSLTQNMQEKVIAGQLTAENGDFSLVQLPVRGKFTLKISVLGYAKLERPVAFEGRNFDMDLGNIGLTTEALTMDEVVIEGENSSVVLALDKKIYRVDKDMTAAGGTAEDALKNVPSLSVDIDGNLTVRNSSPQLFVDGRPTTLTLDQIPADAIETVEVITNPSAKYDASGGQAGIVNIVLKKNRRIGYNGNIRTGVDTRGGYNFGGDINLREGKINTFVSAFVNQRSSQGEGETVRNNFFGNPVTNIFQVNENDFTGRFANIRGGVDWFIDNRNTLTFSASITDGQFKPYDLINIRTDSLYSTGTTFSEAVRESNSERHFQNLGGSVLFKHLYPKKGREWTADLNYNHIKFDGMGNFQTNYFNSEIESREQQISEGGSRMLTAQTDYVDPLTKNIKLEAGLRASVRTQDNNNYNALYNPSVNDYVRVPNFADLYNFDDQIYAAYATISHQFTKWGYMAGLRAESSTYTGTLPESGTTFNNDYPLSLFPSFFATYKLNEQDNLQASYTRRINRPNFFQLLPFTDFSDSLNLRRGNPNLLPEFTNSFEVSYQNILSEGNDFLLTAYYKQASDLITTYQFSEYDPVLDREFLISSYTNSNSSMAYGVELTLRNSFLKIFELSSNINLYNSRVDASNVEQDLVNEQFTWNVKENLNIKLPADFRLQLSGEYRSKAAFTPSSGGRFGGWRGVTNTAQGYTLPNWYVDAALRKDLFKRKVSLSVSVRDIFASRKMGTYSESAFFVQESWRIRNPQTVMVNLSYRFGKPDVSLFNRKNNRINTEGSDMMN